MSASGLNDLGRIFPQFLSMAADVEVQYISKNILLTYHALYGGLLLVCKVPGEGRRV